MKYEDYSVLMSVYVKDNPAYLDKSIKSMLNQTIITDDFVIVEDGPLTQELQEVLDGYMARYEFIHIVKKDRNAGLGAALNTGLQICKNELIARMDADDISLPERCERELNAFNENNDLDIVGTFIYEFSNVNESVINIKKMPISQQDIMRYAARRNPFNHSTVMYKKTSIMKNGGYMEKQRGEDFELFTKMIFNGACAMNIAEPLLKYRAAEDQYKRRTSKTEVKAVLGVAQKNYQNGYIGTLDYLYIIATQIAALLMPEKVGRIIYRKLFRKKI